MINVRFSTVLFRMHAIRFHLVDCTMQPHHAQALRADCVKQKPLAAKSSKAGVAKTCSGHSRISHDVMEPEVLLQISQEPSTDPYPKLDESRPHSNNILVSTILILYIHLRPGPPSFLFAQVFLPKTCRCSSSLSCVLHALPL